MARMTEPCGTAYNAVEALFKLCVSDNDLDIGGKKYMFNIDDYRLLEGTEEEAILVRMTNGDWKLLN